MKPPNGWQFEGAEDWWPSYWAKSYQHRGWTIRVYQTLMPGICEATCWKFGASIQMFNVEGPTLDVVLLAAKNSVDRQASRKI